MQTLSILLLKEDGGWSAQCLEIDIAAQGDTIKKAVDQLQFIIVSEVAFAVERQREPFEGIDRAPQHFWALYDSAGEKQAPV